MKPALALVMAGLVLSLAACERPAAVHKGLAPPSEIPSTNTADSTTPSPHSVKPQKYRGRGDKIVRIKDGDEAWLAAFTHTGSSNFIVSALDPSGDESDVLVNVIGGYKGTVLFNDEADSNTRALKIKADGAWTLRLKPPSDARLWDGERITGKGDDVLRFADPSYGFTTMKLTHRGDSNFIVDSYTEDSAENLVNEIGRYSGEVSLPGDTVLITVHADGKWTLTWT
ncbi:hypothetical protein [Actinomadura formosensis]|uniref:hypothetical protein n=1 Tax=Actinomadura formosensis TaxID=60706 RepID=UPI000B04540A|nr:hypothetical protein [Actinomadura formosensis]